MAKQVTDADLALLEELGVDSTPEQTGQYTPLEERVIAGFEEIERFVAEHGRPPAHGENHDIFERLYAVRLDRLREAEEFHELLAPLDTYGLLTAESDRGLLSAKELDDANLLAALGVDTTPVDEISQLTHVRPRQEIKAAEEVAQRTPCADFAEFKPLFAQVQRELETGERQTRKYQDNAAVNQGDLFILDGQKVLVAELGEEFTSDYGRRDRRLRVIYDNGTESDLLLRSLQRALNKDKASRRITSPDLGPLFALSTEVNELLISDIEEESDLSTGYIYVLRSKSTNEFIAEHPELIHKIGVTGGDVKKRVANARKDPTYLLADVEIVATFKLANINRKKLEALLQKVFRSVRLDLELQDRFDTPVKPQEWFLVPLEAIAEAIDRIKDGTIAQWHYDPEKANFLKVSPSMH